MIFIQKFGKQGGLKMSNLWNGKCGVALISFDRPHYFSQTIKSIEEQSHLENTDFHLFQDGQVNKFSGNIVTDKRLIDKNISIFEKSKLPNKTLHIEPKNIGNALNQFNAVEYLSSNYEYFMIIEDDVILSPDYFRLVRLVIDQYLSKTKIFSFGFSFQRFCKLKEIDKYLDKMILKNVHWWAECWSSKNWTKVRPYFLQYLEFVKNVEYTKRPSEKIKKFFSDNKFYIPQTSQDAGKDFALFKAKMKRMTSVVNRGFYIGEHGLHFRKSTYERYGFKDMKPFVFDSDKIIERFKLI